MFVSVKHKEESLFVAVNQEVKEESGAGLTNLQEPAHRNCREMLTGEAETGRTSKAVSDRV